jgi:hypothetical protein
MCVEKGMVAGHTHAIDSAPIKADASIENLELKAPAQPIKAHFKAVESDNPDEKTGSQSDKTSMCLSPPTNDGRETHEGSETGNSRTGLWQLNTILWAQQDSGTWN